MQKNVCDFEFGLLTMGVFSGSYTNVSYQLYLIYSNRTYVCHLTGMCLTMICQETWRNTYTELVELEEQGRCHGMPKFVPSEVLNHISDKTK